jgi:trans-aconitate methyltransferase
MNEPKTQLHDEKQSAEFYEDRYEQGYMEEWPIEKKRKILRIIRELQLPPEGEALDFGCGNGVVTEIIRQALPAWKVYGTDISGTAIANANNRYPDCTFFTADDPEFGNKKFDLVFTHHVFEHVYDLNEVFGQMNEYLKPEAAMIHFLPCGNKGSFEHKISLLRKEGIDKELGNRYFFEDKGHVRRLTTEEMRRLCETKGFELKKEYYSNQYYGAVNWITTYSPKFVLNIADASRAVDEDASRKLRIIRRQLILITALRLPVQMVNKFLHKKNKKLKHYVLLGLGLPLYPFSYPFDRYWKQKAAAEFNARSHERNGSEMCLYFQRG